MQEKNPVKSSNSINSSLFFSFFCYLADILHVILLSNNVFFHSIPEKKNTIVHRSGNCQVLDCRTLIREKIYLIVRAYAEFSVDSFKGFFITSNIETYFFIQCQFQRIMSPNNGPWFFSIKNHTRIHLDLTSLMAKTYISGLINFH